MAGDRTPAVGNRPRRSSVGRTEPVAPRDRRRGCGRVGHANGLVRPRTGRLGGRGPGRQTRGRCREIGGDGRDRRHGRDRRRRRDPAGWTANGLVGPRIDGAGRMDDGLGGRRRTSPGLLGLLSGAAFAGAGGVDPPCSGWTGPVGHRSTSATSEQGPGQRAPLRYRYRSRLTRMQGDRLTVGALICALSGIRRRLRRGAQSSRNCWSRGRRGEVATVLEQPRIDRVEEPGRRISRSAPRQNRRRAWLTNSRSCARVSPTKNSRRSSASARGLVGGPSRPERAAAAARPRSRRGTRPETPGPSPRAASAA